MPQFSPSFVQRKLPKQDTDKIILLADRWNRAAESHRIWAESAKECVDFLEGRQWTKDQILALEKEGRPALVMNKIRPLVRLIIGYHRNNRTDIKFNASGEASSSDDTAEVLSRLVKHAGEHTDLKYVDTEVFLDGITTGRGYYRDLINYGDNVNGEIKSKAMDPFTVYIDPDCDTYDLDKSSTTLQTTRWISIDEIEFEYGREVAEALDPFVTGANAWTTFPQLHTGTDDEVTPVRNFGLDDDIGDALHGRFRDQFHENFIDSYRKNIRLLDSEYYVTTMENVFIDLETGDMRRIPSDWPQERIDKVLFLAEQRGNPMIVERMKMRRVRWTIIVGDIVVFDDWSPYETFSIRGYFPYFRRGITQGMVHDLRDPQKEVNKRRSAQIEIVGRVANSGWQIEEGAMTPDGEMQLELFGAQNGIIVKTKEGKMDRVKRIDSTPPPTAMERLEDKGNEDIKEIGGVNESALGELDRVQSGRAIEARQRQAVIGFQMYIDNFSRTKKLQGRKWLNLIQKFYTEERVFRILGEDDKRTLMWINQQIIGPSGQSQILNDVTVGKYEISVDETPMSASFQNAQFEEALLILEKLGPIGQALMQSRPDLLVGMSSLPRKEEWTQAMQEALGLAGDAPLDGNEPPLPGDTPLTGPALDQGALPGGNVVQIDARTGQAG